MTRKSRREVEREVRDLSDRAGETGGRLIVACEHDDGTLTTPDGDPLPPNPGADGDIVLNVSWRVAQTWP